MQVSVVVPTYNRRDMVVRCIQTLLRQEFPPAQYEIIAVVDGSSDGTPSALRELKSSSRLEIIEQENRGLAAARNSGLHRSRGDIVIFVDDDMLCESQLVSEHFAAHACERPVIAVGAVFLSDDTPLTLAAECFNREVGAFFLQDRKHPVSAGTPPLIFGNTSVRRQWLMDAGGFDERFRMREDADLAIRLCSAGLRTAYVRNAVAYQQYRKTSADLIRDAVAFAPADLLFASKHPEARVPTFLSRIAAESRWKRVARKAAAISPRCVDAVLAPVCTFTEARMSSSLCRRVGVRALQIRRGVHWYHHVRRLQQKKATALIPAASPAHQG